MDEMRFGYGQTAVYSRPGRKIDEKQGWNTSLMMVMMMDGREAQGIMNRQVILRRRRKRCVLHDIIGAIISNTRSIVSVVASYHMRVHIKQVDEIRKGDGARKKVIVERCA